MNISCLGKLQSLTSFNRDNKTKLWGDLFYGKKIST